MLSVLISIQEKHPMIQFLQEVAIVQNQRLIELLVKKTKVCLDEE